LYQVLVIFLKEQFLKIFIHIQVHADVNKNQVEPTLSSLSTSHLHLVFEREILLQSHATFLFFTFNYFLISPDTLIPSQGLKRKRFGNVNRTLDDQKYLLIEINVIQKHRLRTVVTQFYFTDFIRSLFLFKKIFFYLFVGTGD
jgi:hypothetical protein